MLYPMTPDQVVDLVMVLGAAEAAFGEIAADPDLTGLARQLMNDYSQRAKSFREEITRLHNLESKR